MIELIDNDDPRFRAFVWASIRDSLAHGAERGVTDQWRARARMALDRFDAALEKMPLVFRGAVRLEVSAFLLRRRCAWDFADQIATLLEHGGMLLPTSGAVDFRHDESDQALDAEGWISSCTYGSYCDSEEDGRRLHKELLIVADLFQQSGLNGCVVSFRGVRQ